MLLVTYTFIYFISFLYHFWSQNETSFSFAFLSILFLFSVLCGSIDWASKIFYCFFCHFWAQNQFECVPDVVCKGLLCVQFSLKFSVVYLSSSLLQLTVESRDLSQAENITNWENSPNNNTFQSKLLFFHPEPFWWLLSVRFKYKPGDHVTCYKLSALIGWNYSIQIGEKIL